MTKIKKTSVKFKKILITHNSEITCRAIRTAKAKGVENTAV
jgi:acetyl/propionyl-CoA carboxylase alpha subunit